MTTAAALNSRLQSIFSNGRIEVGLEVGSDQGLSPDHYIRIPACFDKNWAYHPLDKPSHRPAAGDSAETLRGQDGWVIVDAGSKHVRIHDGKYYAVDPTGANPVAMGCFHRPAFTVEDIKQFVSVNVSHVRDGDLSLEQREWVHAVRFWAVASGFVCGSKQREWVAVDDAPDTSIVTEDLVRKIIDMGGVAVTASAARAASWRKSNHATGGDIASGFARRWISKNVEGGFPNPPDHAARRKQQRQVTNAFYVATHASCVHPVLAMMAPQITEHWAQIDPRYGMVMSWDVLESTSIRIAPKTQVAGTAIVVDSMVVLKMLVSEGIAPLLESASSYQALINAFKQVENNGIRVATYANWFLDGHPEGIARIPFAQKDASFSDLVGELACVGRTFYRNSTIGESLALENAQNQLATETAKARWSALTKARKSSTDETVMKVYTRVMGASASSALQKLSSDDGKDVSDGVGEYNNLVSNIAQALGVPDPVSLSVDRILGNAGIAAPATTTSSAASARVPATPTATVSFPPASAAGPTTPRGSI